MENEYYNATARKEIKNMTGCKKPSQISGLLTGGLANIGYKKRLKAYNECIARYNESLQASSASVEQIAKAKQEALQAKKELDAINSGSTSGGATGGTRSADKSDSDGKILGMPKTAFYIGLGVIVVVGGFLAYKAIKGAKAVKA